MALYEAHAQEFLRRLVVLVHVAPGPPLQAPELLSVTVRNTPRRRHVFLWEETVMVYVQYHKGQEQPGAYKDNIRFLPRAIGDLLLTYLAYVAPLRQIFLRQSSPDALLSPYLWSTLDGQVWKDDAVSSCLRKACTRAEVPPLQVAWWRQVAASITKEKFGARERANFDHADAVCSKDVEDEADLVHLAGMSNHSYLTFNQAYAGSTTLTMSTLLHRAYRASESWRNLFAIDNLLVSPQEEQGRGVRRGARRGEAAAGGLGLPVAPPRRVHGRGRPTTRSPSSRSPVRFTTTPPCNFACRASETGCSPCWAEGLPSRSSSSSPPGPARRYS